jgi:hypothetical protein
MKIQTQTACLVTLLASTGIAYSEPASFDTPEAAVAAVVAALEAADRNAVLAVFGPENEDILSTGNAVQDKEVWGDFLRDVKSSSQIKITDTSAILYAGRELWPFPIPLVRQGGGWIFDTEAGREEILMRRIGLNELAVIDIMSRAGAVQAEFRKNDHDGDGVKEFASAILSDPGKRNGLFWPDQPGTERSPLGPAIARANDAGYNLDGTDQYPDPYVGYFFRILQGQGPAAPGGAYSYMIGDNMVAGHALIAYPAAYGDSGIMTFMVSESGIIYEADLGENSIEQVDTILRFDPDERWTVAK